MRELRLVFGKCSELGGEIQAIHHGCASLGERLCRLHHVQTSEIE